MIEKIVQEDLIKLNIKANDWKDAVRKSAQPLVDDNYITENYVSEIINSVNEYGPYFVIAPHVALAHAPSESGAEKLAMGISTLEPAIKFNNADNDPVSYVFTLSAPDSDSHLKAMQELVGLLSGSEFYKVLDEAQSSGEILQFIKDSVLNNKVS
ncbi:PTS sugar transporter subunit IIA [Companilactobacillus nodensis]|uniref:Ascorbate-specific PTS system EIIA component n=1 Tax=Companilactobacillus nodensis DSM 19682 = JCM 14932 = NBRC 107160 TaxID=1423775 RepID=A0A0R1KDP5_9LACO|nr:PTS sugar transporter subunit IIA [Companilactobacillus nodensis]KRK78868.1 phosphotransferase system mannitol fructose-specific IIA domain containing protein [Companilactobacillus nodensis DSM 19682 = JCM 14932 = NBRC 107160]